MLEENNSKFTLKKFILTIILVVFILFILVWLFPTKEYITNYIEGALDKRLDEKTDTSENVFNENIKTMKNIAEAYFTDDNLPQKTGDTKKITLEEMIKQKYLLSLNDSEGNSCDLKKSYAEVSIKDGSYVMKVNLSCDSDEDYILVPMGSYDECNDSTCEKKTLNEDENTNNTSSKQCEYAKVTNGKWSSYGAWSNWTTTKITKTNYNEVQSKTEKVANGTKTVTEKKNVTTDSVKQYKTMYVCTDANGNEKTYAKASSCSGSAKEKSVPYYTCPSGYDNEGSYLKPTTCKKTVTTSKNETQYKSVTYYRQRVRSYISGTKSVKWSNCNDTKLINSGYYKTGNTK